MKFRLLLTYTVDSEPIGRVVVLYCHSVYGAPVQGQIGEFSLNEQGTTKLAPDAAGKVPGMRNDAAQAVLTYFRKAFNANASLSG